MLWLCAVWFFDLAMAAACSVFFLVREGEEREGGGGAAAEREPGGTAARARDECALIECVRPRRSARCDRRCALEMSHLGGDVFSKGKW